MIPPLVANDPSLPPAVAGPAFLLDGTEVWVRPFHADDRDLVVDFLAREATEALEPRHFAAIRTGGVRAREAAHASPAEQLCLLALGDRADRVTVLGVGEYFRLRSDSPVAEAAFLVASEFRERGIASLLLSRLARAALGYGLLRFEVRVRRDNPGLLELFRGSGLPYTEQPTEGEVAVFIPLTPDVGASGELRVGAPAPPARSSRRRRRGAARGRRRAATTAGSAN